MAWVANKLVGPFKDKVMEVNGLGRIRKKLVSNPFCKHLRLGGFWLTICSRCGLSVASVFRPRTLQQMCCFVCLIWKWNGFCARSNDLRTPMLIHALDTMSCFGLECGMQVQSVTGSLALLDNKMQMPSLEGPFGEIMLASSTLSHCTCLDHASVSCLLQSLDLMAKFCQIICHKEKGKWDSFLDQVFPLLTISGRTFALWLPPSSAPSLLGSVELVHSCRERGSS